MDDLKPHIEAALDIHEICEGAPLSVSPSLAAEIDAMRQRAMENLRVPKELLFGHPSALDEAELALHASYVRGTGQ